jgi:hypothetical protein
MVLESSQCDLMTGRLGAWPGTSGALLSLLRLSAFDSRRR